MDTNKENQCRTEFKKILFELASSQDLFSEPSKRSSMYRRLENLYHSSTPSNSFRHYYSDIFSVLTSIKQDETGKTGSIDILGANLENILTGYQAMNKDKTGEIINITDNIKKLYDHVSLDIARLTYTDGVYRKISEEENVDNLKADINQFEGKVSDIAKTVTDVEQKLEKSQQEYIAILGIFASVVLTFISGIAFSTSVLENLHNASIYRIVLITLLIGFVLVNVLFVLFHFIGKLLKKDKESSNGSNNVIKGKPVVIINIVIIVFMTITVVCWFFGAVEKRNETVLTQNNSSTATICEYTPNNSHSFAD